ncbi:MAG: GHKL domain-containing protein [Gammaproteobacteria bacterium]|nr:GHKL domain-containing protein [Gammaproteobacteria bacterium]
MTIGTEPVWNKEINADNLQRPFPFESNSDDDTPNSANNLPSAQAEREALLQFSDISRKFINSYTHLEQHVDRLSSELAAQTAEKKQQYEEKNRLAERLEKILSTLPSAVIVIDGHGRVQESNALAEDMLGLPIVGETWIAIISRAFSPRSDDGHEISLKDGRRVKVETRALGSEPGQIVLLTDLTETRILQEHQSREDRLSVIGKMMASLAHQIRTPLSSALLYSGHISSQKLDEQRQQRFHLNLQHSLKQLERQVSDMLLFASGGTSSKQRFGIDELLVSLNADINSHIVAKEIDIVIDGLETENSSSEISLFGNIQSLLGAIANLVENSIHACRENSSNGKLIDISISLEKNTKNTISISVHDNGCGISDINKERIFEPFYTTRARGTGLGLAVVNTIINSFKGKVRIESEESSGTTIEMILPCIVADSFSVNADSKENFDNNVNQQVVGG